MAATSFCDSLSISPAMANDCPSRSSTSVSARRVFSAAQSQPVHEDDKVGSSAIRREPLDEKIVSHHR
jgi:hypothetical protein